MDYETKILLHRLVEEVEKLNSPDWWVIAITIINAGFMAWLGWRQYKLQQRQTGAQEYELYRKLAHTIKEIHYEVKNVMYEFYYYLNNQIPILENLMP